MSDYLSESDRYLNSLVDEELYGSAEYTRQGTKLAIELWEMLLEANLELSFSRPPAIGGSAGKRTHLGSGKYDFDTILPINVPSAIKMKYGSIEKIPNKVLGEVITDAIKKIADFLETRAKTDPDLKFKESWRVCVTVTYKSLDFDLVPAINFLEGNTDAKNTQWVRVHHRYVEVEPNVFGPSTFAKVLEYLLGREGVSSEENNFCLRVIVLAKKWRYNARVILKTAKNGLKKVEKMCSESTVIETVAMVMAQEEYSKWKEEKSITRAFKKFLGTMAKPIEEVKIIPSRSGVAFTPEAKKQLDINEKMTGGLVADSVDPWLNYLDYLDPKRYNVIEGWAELQWAAKKSNAILNDGCKCGCGKRTWRHALGIFVDGEEGFPGYD